MGFLVQFIVCETLLVSIHYGACFWNLCNQGFSSVPVLASVTMALSSGGVVHGSLRTGDIGLHCQRADGLLVTNSENFRSMAHRLLTSQRLDDREAVLSYRSQRSLRKHW